jgi:hypothetical protein
MVRMAAARAPLVWEYHYFVDWQTSWSRGACERLRNSRALRNVLSLILKWAPALPHRTSQLLPVPGLGL